MVVYTCPRSIASWTRTALAPYLLSGYNITRVRLTDRSVAPPPRGVPMPAKPKREKPSKTLYKAAGRLHKGDPVVALALGERGYIDRLKEQKACPPKKASKKR